MKIRYATEYAGYLVERFVCVGAGVDALDTSQTVEHFHSTGWDEPIISTGQGPRYSISEIEIPNWLVSGLKIQHDNAEELAAKICSGYYDEVDLYRALRYLTCATKPGKFQRSLMDWYTTHGTFSNKQINAVLNPPKFYR